MFTHEIPSEQIELDPQAVRVQQTQTWAGVTFQQGVTEYGQDVVVITDPQHIVSDETEIWAVDGRNEALTWMLQQICLFMRDANLRSCDVMYANGKPGEISPSEFVRTAENGDHQSHIIGVISGAPVLRSAADQGEARLMAGQQALVMADALMEDWEEDLSLIKADDLRAKAYADMATVHRGHAGARIRMHRGKGLIGRTADAEIDATALSRYLGVTRAVVNRVMNGEDWILTDAVTLVSAQVGDLVPGGVELAELRLPFTDRADVTRTLTEWGYGPDDSDELVYALVDDTPVPEGLESKTFRIPAYEVQGIRQEIAHQRAQRDEDRS